MSRQYSNFKSFLTSVGYTVIVPENEFINSKKISFKCKQNHETIMAATSFMNKKSSCKDNPEDLCTDCFKNKEKQDTFKIEKNNIFKLTGHELISVDGRENTIYKCKNCNRENKTHLSNLKKNKGSCPSCQNEKFKNNIPDVEQRLKKFNLKLVDYKDCHDLNIICKCGKEFKTTLHNIKRGRLCIDCKIERSQQTNLVKYGVDNPFKSPEIKQKIKETNLKKYGVDHALKNKDILDKVKNTNKDKYGVEFVFHTKEAVRKGRETMMKKYGVEFPLQSEFIRAKVRQTFLDVIGYEYPLLSPELREIYIQRSKQKILDKYGVDSYFKTEKFKINHPIYHQRAQETCMDKYGAYCYFNTKIYKQHCLDKYGVEFHIQRPEIFSKCQRAMFSVKEYKFPSGRTAYIRGYEPRCIDILLTEGYHEDDIIVETCDIPVIPYIKLNKDNTEQKAVYYPDILLPNKLIEVKSVYIYNKDLENNKRKFKACIELGYDIDMWLFDVKNLIEIHSYTKDNLLIIKV